jgi:hypothetical protein
LGSLVHRTSLAHRQGSSSRVTATTDTEMTVARPGRDQVFWWALTRRCHGYSRRTYSNGKVTAPLRIMYGTHKTQTTLCPPEGPGWSISSTCDSSTCAFTTNSSCAKAAGPGTRRACQQAPRAARTTAGSLSTNPGSDGCSHPTSSLPDHIAHGRRQR